MATLLIRDVRVFDGVSDRPLPRASVIVEGAHVRAVVVGAVSVPDGARIIDGRGHTLLPGLIDMHSHLVSELGARLYLANGITSVRFAGNDPDAVLELRERIESGRVPGPRVFSLGPLLDGVSPDYPAISWPLASANEARVAVRRLRQRLPGSNDTREREAKDQVCLVVRCLQRPGGALVSLAIDERARCAPVFRPVAGGR